MDFTKPETQELIKETLQGKEVNVVLSDMAPSATGIRDLDNENMMTLCYNVLRFAVQVSGTGGALLLKLWQCGEAKTLEENMLKFYKSVKFVKPHASRVDSAEIFLLGREFKGLVKNSWFITWLICLYKYKKFVFFKIINSHITTRYQQFGFRKEYN